MYRTNGVHCFYVDHSFYDVRHIGSTYSTLKKETMLRGNTDIIVATCQRIEAFTAMGTNPFIAHLDLPFRHISGQDRLKERILSICSGIESQLLGEKNIYYQVKKACGFSTDDNAMKGMFLDALDTAMKIRIKHNFYSSMDYEDVSTSILQEHVGDKPASELNLVIVGSGMLARNFLKEQIISQYKNIFFLTRSKRNLKKKMEQHLKQNVLTCDEFVEKNKGDFHCIVATSRIDKDNYLDAVKGVLTFPSCKGVFDLSASPLFEDIVISGFYADTYSPIYNKYIVKHNKNMQDKRQLIRSVISEYL